VWFLWLGLGQPWCFHHLGWPLYLILLCAIIKLIRTVRRALFDLYLVAAIFVALLDWATGHPPKFIDGGAELPLRKFCVKISLRKKVMKILRPLFPAHIKIIASGEICDPQAHSGSMAAVGFLHHFVIGRYARSVHGNTGGWRWCAQNCRERAGE
jgi:hypothetical protein